MEAVESWNYIPVFPCRRTIGRCGTHHGSSIVWAALAVSYEGYNLCNFEGACLFGRKFSGEYLKLEISAFKPDLVINFPGFEVEEGLFFHLLLCEFVSGLHFLSCVLNLVQLLLESWKRGSSKRWVGSGFVSHD